MNASGAARSYRRECAWTGGALILLVLLLPLTIYVLRLDDVAGMMVDDGWYVMLARALAKTGYWLVNRVRHSPAAYGLRLLSVFGPVRFPGIGCSKAYRLPPCSVWPG
jgi:hypothetical protein